MMPTEPKRDRVAHMFSRLVPVYDRMNRVLSMGLDARWRRSAARGLERGAPVLDVGAGTGDLAFAILSSGNPGPVILLDLSVEMLHAARAKAATLGLDDRVLPLVGDGEHLPLRDGAASAVVSAFVLRNLDDPARFFAESARVLTVRGRVVFLEIARPPRGLNRWLFSIYFFRLMPAAARLLTRQASAYAYLAASVRAFPAPQEVRRSLERAGFPGATVEALAGGMVAIYRGIKR